MKFVIAVDLEGIAGVVGQPNMTLTESKDYDFACRQATKEADAAAKALFDAGAKQVIVWDNHGGSLNLEYEELDKRCDILLGVGFPHRWTSMDEDFDGVILIGYHPMDNTVDGVLAHTFSSVSYQWIKINEREVGEIAIDAAMAGEKGVPVILVASDDKGAKEAKDFLPWAETVATKIGFGRNAALSKHPDRVIDEIYEKTKRAVKRLGEMRPFAFEEPMDMEIRFKKLEGAEGMGKSDGWKRIDAYTVKGRLNKISEYY
ncbi:MAG: M55 family metallopeptidase [Clostridiales bacterium]|nr:M55 family metallopeptidase [Clostridiales bacterium]